MFYIYLKIKYLCFISKMKYIQKICKNIQKCFIEQYISNVLYYYLKFQGKFGKIPPKTE